MPLDAKLNWGLQITKLLKLWLTLQFTRLKKNKFQTEKTSHFFSYFHSLLTYGILLSGNTADIKEFYSTNTCCSGNIGTMWAPECLWDITFKKLTFLHRRHSTLMKM